VFYLRCGLAAVDGADDRRQQGAVDFRAHIGGVIAGMLLIPLFKRKNVPLRRPWGGR
jgi:membrane associated rhomboid family serine protease